MAKDHITITLSCPCGGKLQTQDDIPNDRSIVTCNSCGKRIGTYGEVIAEARRRAVKEAKKVVQPHIDKLKDTIKSINRRLKR